MQAWVAKALETSLFTTNVARFGCLKVASGDANGWEEISQKVCVYGGKCSWRKLFEADRPSENTIFLVIILQFGL